MTLAREHRKPIPLGVKLKAALALAGFTEDEIETPGAIEYDHAPALALRVVDEETGELVPPANDWRCIRPRRKADHRAKTCGRKGEKRVTSYGSDIHAVAKCPRLAKKEAEFRQRLLAKDEGEPRRTPQRPGRKLQSRPFQNPKKGARR